MAAKILSHKSTRAHKRNANDQPQRELRSIEDWHRRDLHSWLGHVKEELGDVSETLEGIARTSILLEKLSGETQLSGGKRARLTDQQHCRMARPDQRPNRRDHRQTLQSVSS